MGTTQSKAGSDLISTPSVCCTPSTDIQRADSVESTRALSERIKEAELDGQVQQCLVLLEVRNRSLRTMLAFDEIVDGVAAKGTHLNWTHDKLMKSFSRKNRTCRSF